MNLNAREEKYQEVELFSYPALFTNGRIDRGSVPKGFYCYDLRGSDNDPGQPVTIEKTVAVNHAASVLTSKAVKLPQSGYKRLKDGLNFMGDTDITLSEFCTKHNINLEPDKRKFTLRPAEPSEAGIFYALSPEKDQELGTVGHLRIDFGRSGKEFWSTWWPRDAGELSTLQFSTQLDEFVNELRGSYGPLESLSAMSSFCYQNGGVLNSEYRQHGFVAETENYRYCIRCNPVQGDYNAYLTVYDLQVQRMNMEQAEECTQQMGGIQL